MTEVMSVIGTRPEIIRMSCLIPLLDRSFDHRLVYTSQHYSQSMSEVFFRELRVRKPDAALDVNGSGIRELSSAIGRDIRRSKPDFVLVYGDTNTVMAGALAAKENRTKLIHVEAGFRSFDGRMPEERTRVFADHEGGILFAPSKLAGSLLAAEGIKKNVFVVGDLTLDALRRFSAEAKKSRILKELGLGNEPYVLFTAHRQENVDSKRNLSQLVRLLSAVEEKVVYPVHPRTQKMLRSFGLRLPG
ncbi:MAG: UDP-N-acetylglucosamine 2-epimerase, partial [Candidatus Altiarchaeota archaeon]|nr:UDP-N-acetylglucosamine 2-epimerase [Candidatus Altiarchaeota archaeon]